MLCSEPIQRKPQRGGGRRPPPSAHRSARNYESAVFEISDVLFCAQESQNSSKFIFRDFRRVVLHTGVPEFLKVEFLRFLTFCSAHRSPRIPESGVFDISDILFCAQESQNSRKLILFRFPTSCSAHRSPRIPGSHVFEISDVLFCAQESQKS